MWSGESTPSWDRCSADQTTICRYPVPDMIASATQAFVAVWYVELDDVAPWRDRPLDTSYPVMVLDASGGRTC